MRKPETISFWTGRLPHWEVEGGYYFITIHLAGAIPAAGRNRLRNMAGSLVKTKRKDSPAWIELQRKIFREMEAWLDRSVFTTHLREETIAEMVMEAISHRQQRGDWNVFEYVIMPTHIHLFCEIGRKGMKATLNEFKRWTGHQAAKLLGVDGERFWQREWFDHWSRSDAEDDRIIQYIRNNPVKAGLVALFSDWPFASWNKTL